MPCLILLIGIAFPRLAIVLLFLFTTFLERAYHSLLLLVLGFIFLPLTTIVYAWIVNGRHPIDGIYLAAIILAVLADLGKKNVVSVMIEGGGSVLGHVLDQHLVDKVQIFIAPIFTGGGVVAFAGDGTRSTSEAARLERVRFEKIGPELCVIGYPKYSVIAAA